MRLNLWLVFRLHWTQSEPIKHMSIMSFWDMGSCKNLWIYGRHICKRNGLFLVPRSADLTWTFSANDTMWSLRKPLNASFMSDLSDNLSFKSSGRLHRRAWQLWAWFLHYFAKKVLHYCMQFHTPWRFSALTCSRSFLLSHPEWSDSSGQVILFQA